MYSIKRPLALIVVGLVVMFCCVFVSYFDEGVSWRLLMYPLLILAVLIVPAIIDIIKKDS